nr:cold-shock protein [Acetobacter garciniae]
MSSAEDTRGTVKWYNAVKGFGFITPEGGGKDIFIHASALERSGLNSLSEGQGVNVKVVQGQKGPEAAEVTSS